MFEEHLFHLLFNLLRTKLGKGIRQLRRKLRKLRKHHWIEVPAKIDVVSVAVWVEPLEFIRTYMGTLTYFYRNPDLHTGDYSVEFDDEWQARAWVSQFKGLQVKVRVNPRDPDDSVLLELPIRHPVYIRPPAPPILSGPSPKPVTIRALSSSQKRWAENTRLISIAGIGASLVVLGLSITSGGHAHSRALFWFGGCLLTAVVVSLGISSLAVTTEGTLRSASRFYALWCARKTSWFLISSGAVLFILFLYSMDRMQFPAESRAKIGVHIPYIAASWGFLVSWALHNAILRSQQDVAAHHQGHPQTT
jgi:hypothetical protein